MVLTNGFLSGFLTHSEEHKKGGVLLHIVPRTSGSVICPMEMTLKVDMSLKTQ